MCRNAGCSLAAALAILSLASTAYPVTLAPGDIVTLSEFSVMSVEPSTGNRTVISGCITPSCSSVIGSGPPAPFAFGSEFSGGVAVAANGDILVTHNNGAVIAVDPATGDRTLVSGCVGVGCLEVGTGPSLNFPSGLAIVPESDPTAASLPAWLLVFLGGLLVGLTLRARTSERGRVG